jgi:hypothetical protein
MGIPDSPGERAALYAARRGIKLLDILGSGKDGYVWYTNQMNAVKAHQQLASYTFERDAYIRIHDLQLSTVAEFNVPRPVNFDDELWVIEMTTVVRPHVVDFASARLDVPPGLIEDEGHTIEDMVRERFEERADDVIALYYELITRAGIYLTDLHPHNIKFADEPGAS